MLLAIRVYFSTELGISFGVLSYLLNFVGKSETYCTVLIFVMDLRSVKDQIESKTYMIFYTYHDQLIIIKG